MLKEKIDKANKEIKKAVDYLKNHQEIFKAMDLKLYDASYYFMSEEMRKDFPLAYKNNENSNGYDDFYYFCEDNYIFFTENLNILYGIDFSKMKKHIGRTSSFYLHDMEIINIDRYGCLNIDDIIYNFINYYFNNQYGNYIDIVNESIKIEKTGEEEEAEINYIIEDFYNDIISYCADIVTVYNIINDFKENQVKYFKEFLQIEEERLQEEQEKIKVQKEYNFDRCVKIQKKYNISNEDINILKMCIADY